MRLLAAFTHSGLDLFPPPPSSPAGSTRGGGIIRPDSLTSVEGLVELLDSDGDGDGVDRHIIHHHTTYSSASSSNSTVGRGNGGGDGAGSGARQPTVPLSRGQLMHSSSSAAAFRGGGSGITATAGPQYQTGRPPAVTPTTAPTASAVTHTSPAEPGWEAIRAPSSVASSYGSPASVDGEGGAAVAEEAVPAAAGEGGPPEAAPSPVATADEFAGSSGAGDRWQEPADTAGAGIAPLEEPPPLPPLGGGASLPRRATAFGRGARVGSRLRSIGHGPGGAEGAPPAFGEVEEAAREAPSAATAGAVAGVSRRRGGTAGAGSPTAQRRQGLWWLETWPGAGLVTWLGQQLDAR